MRLGVRLVRFRKTEAVSGEIRAGTEAVRVVVIGPLLPGVQCCASPAVPFSISSFAQRQFAWDAELPNIHFQRMERRTEKQRGGENRATHPFVNVVRAELHSGVWHYPYAICSISGHEPSPAFLPPHLRQCLGNRHLVFFAANALDLE